MRESDRRWPWYQQAIDAVFAVAALVVLGVMTARNSYPLYGVFVILVFAGRLSSSAVLRYLTGRWEAENK